MEKHTTAPVIVDTVLEALHEAEEQGTVRRVFTEDGKVYFNVTHGDGEERTYSLHIYEVI